MRTLAQSNGIHVGRTVGKKNQRRRASFVSIFVGAAQRLLFPDDVFIPLLTLQSAISTNTAVRTVRSVEAIITIKLAQ